MRFSVYQASNIGGRKVNQDRMGYSFTRDSLLLVLADGMGGHLFGEVAATIALQTIGSLFQQQANPMIIHPERFLENSFLAAHKEIHQHRAKNKLSETPRTTIVACLVQNGHAYWAHCGDSRLYWMRNGQIIMRTKDHSRLEMLIAQGRADASQRNTHPDRNKLYNCLGAPNAPIVELSRRASLQSGDLILLCSDGLWSVLPDHVLAQSMHEHTIVRAIPELVLSATDIAGKHSDNVTALAVMWEGGGHVSDTSIISTNTLPVGSLTTTILATPGEDAEQDLNDIFNDAEIEKAISEINIAIHNSGATQLKPPTKN